MITVVKRENKMSDTSYIDYLKLRNNLLTQKNLIKSHSYGIDWGIRVAEDERAAVGAFEKEYKFNDLDIALDHFIAACCNYEVEYPDLKRVDKLDCGIPHVIFATPKHNQCIISIFPIKR